MALTEAERQAALEQALAETKDRGAAAQAEAATRILMTQPSQTAADQMWLFLVRGLVVLVGVTLIAIVVLIIRDEYNDVLLTLFSSLLTGLLGLFIESPTTNST